MSSPNRRPLDYRLLRVLIPPREVLSLLSWHCSAISGDYRRGNCPVHRSTHRSSRCFQAGPQIVYCHKCKYTGDAVSLWAKVKGLSTLEAAYDLCERLGIDPPFLSS